MRIEKITLIQFDEQKERERILKNFSRNKLKRFQPWLLGILDAFIANDWDKACEQVRNAPEREDDPPLEYIHTVVFDTLKEYATTKKMREALEQQTDKSMKFASDTAALMMDMQGLPTGPDRYDYPKFRVLPADTAPAA